MRIIRVNISAGVTYLNDFRTLESICKKLYEKGVIVISAFDNDGAISFPAAFKSVLGVDVEKLKNKNKIISVDNAIADLIVAEKFYRTLWKETTTNIISSRYLVQL